MAAHSSIILGFVSDIAQTDDIASGKGGMLEILKPGTLFATGSTLGPQAVQRIARQIADKGGDTLDIPLSAA